MRTYRRKTPYKKQTYTRKRVWSSELRKRAKKNLTKSIKEVLTKVAEAKCQSAVFNGGVLNASQMQTTQLTDISQGITQNQRIGAEIIGNNFQLYYNVYNKTNNELYVRVTLIEEDTRGSTGGIDTTSSIYRDPAGNVTSYTSAISVAQNAPVMWQYDKSSVKVLKDQILYVPRNSGGNDGSNRKIYWNIPWHNKIRWANDGVPSSTVSGAYNQSKRVCLLTTAWAPVGGTQSTYTYDVDGWVKFNFKDI